VERRPRFATVIHAVTLGQFDGTPEAVTADTAARVIDSMNDSITGYAHAGKGAVRRGGSEPRVSAQRFAESKRERHRASPVVLRNRR